MILAGNMAPSTPVYFPAAQPIYPYVAQMPYIPPPTPQPSSSYQTPATSTSSVTFETRKIVITGLPRSITDAELGDLLGQQFSSKSRHRGAVQSLEVARYPDGSPKGHAFVVLETHEIARRLVGRLDKLKFQGRELKARLAKEGADRGYGDGGSMQDHVRQYTPPVDDYHLPSLAENGIERDMTGLMGDLTLASSALSTSRERSKEKQERSSSRSTDKEGERKSKKEGREKEKATKSSAPLVVDGSCGRGKRRR
jgi:RNA recognition motif-containing protein